MSLQSQRYSEAELPTPWGRFRIVVYHFGTEEAVAMVRGEPAGQEQVLCRVHSECLTGEVFGSLRCDCRLQLERALERIAGSPSGVLVYLRQEGRGIGLGNKVRAYALQDQGHDTVEANLALGFAADLRSYDMAAAILSDLGVSSVRLMTNNPAKIEGLQVAGAVVAAHESHWVESAEQSHGYLEAKRIKMGHMGDRNGALAPVGPMGTVSPIGPTDLAGVARAGAGSNGNGSGRGNRGVAAEPRGVAGATPEPIPPTGATKGPPGGAAPSNKASAGRDKG